MKIRTSLASIGSAAAMLLLIGAGCTPAANNNTNSVNEGITIDANSNTTTVNVNGTTDTNVNAASNTNTTTDSGNTNSAAPVNTTPAPADWETYTNAALGFSFKWPSKGTHAPQWAVSFYGESDAKVKDGCFVADGTNSKITGGGVEFCHTSSEVKDMKAMDWYTGKIGKQFVVISFTKTTTNKDYDWKAYRGTLDEIIKTFATKQ